MQEIAYEQNGDYLIPNIIMDEVPEGKVTKYGLMRKNFIMENKRYIYLEHLTKGTWKQHLLEVQEQAQSMMDTLVPQMMQREGVTEKLKAENQMLWVQKMNSIKARAEEIVQKEIIYI